MMNNKLKYVVYVVLLITLCSSGLVFAQAPVRTGPASPEEIKKAQTAVEADPNSQSAYKAYIYAMGLNNPLLISQYKVWIKKYPENINIPLAFGTVYYRAEMPQAKEYLLKAAAMEPKNAKVWFMLSADAGMRGQNDLSNEYMKKAALADSSNALYAYGYLTSFKDSDPSKYKQKVFEFVKRFPENERGAQALYWLGEDATDLDERTQYFEDLRKLYPPQKFDWSSSGMIALADIYLQTKPEKAIALINEMGDSQDWKIRKQVAESLIMINKSEQNQNYKDALTELKQVKLPKFNYIDDFIALKKAHLLEKAGYVKTAYDTLAVKFAKLPTDELYAALELYGKKIGKDKKQVDKDIQNIRNNIAVPAYPFELGLYTSNSKLNLNNLKGKVVLLTFWFPGCGPCKEEFPHFQVVIDKFKGENVSYLGINVFPGQDAYVMPFMKNNKYSFIPLRGSTDFAAKYYNVQSEPENFLIDKDGKIVFRNFRINNSNRRTLELMIASLLK
ncbi:redoxin domain-containing protein [Mucilaginibacter rigui]|uniref:Redoxin domain-containing protein n=1 Tax=Mucilaginibacter rigui TaxID=534635 RepID=A0ABR7X9E1_9SPHI|nr:redoxin domain-containing protein [Mucilaginibacter rigui]MBD1387190.1 redoxin domain-containing protein [Mucilaginibacter rigui]